jgi:ABC-2 type transport system ATP-binding protein
MNFALEANGLGKRYRRRWALRACDLAIPAGHVVGLVGPNGAGKTTLLQMAVGLRKPTTGTIEVLGSRPSDSPAQLERVGFVAQDTPTYAGLSVEKHLRMGRMLNPKWDREFAADRLKQIGLDPRQKTGSLSGGERAQLALTLAMAKCPDLLLLDEPIASLDPLARRDFLKNLMEFVATREVSVLLSSHIVGDLERICDYLVILVASEVRLSGEVSSILGSHRRISGPRRDASSLPSDQEVIEESHTERQSTFLVRTSAPILDPTFTVTPLSLDDLVVAYMSAARAGHPGHEAPVRKSQMAVVR